MPGRVDVEVEVVGADTANTLEANAFRVIPDGPDFLLDFIQANQDEATVVARLRVAKAFVPSLMDRCQSVGA